ncbi:Group XV phospholipase A2 [Nymphon striatum]|nr:Group XV phospholipase A2 [Nymphon striatum]
MRQLSILILGVTILQICNAFDLNPIVLVPGYTGSRLSAELNKTVSVHPWCVRKASDYIIWLNVGELLPFAINCFVDNMKLRYDNVTRRTYDADGVHITAPGFGDTKTIEYIDPHQILSQGDYYGEMVKFLISKGYQRNITLRGAPYDFRRAPNEQDAYFDRLKQLIEETYVKNLYKKVVLVGHSMGCDMLLQFLSKKVDKAWKDSRIKAFISLAGPYGGTAGSVMTMISGTNFGSKLIHPKVVRPYSRSQTATTFFFPSKRAWKSDEVLVTTLERNYTANDYPQLFKDLDYETGKEMWLDTKDLITDNTVPGVETHCLYGTGTKTTTRIEYGKGFPDTLPSAIIFGDGDGTVNRQSLELCKQWPLYQNEKFFHRTYPGVSHIELIKDQQIFDYILDVVREKQPVHQ